MQPFAGDIKIKTMFVQSDVSPSIVDVYRADSGHWCEASGCETPIHPTAGKEGGAR